MMNTFIEKRKRAISHSTMKSNNRNIIQCSNNTHQGAPRTGKQTRAYASDLGDGQPRYLYKKLNVGIDVFYR